MGARVTTGVTVVAWGDWPGCALRLCFSRLATYKGLICLGIYSAVGCPSAALIPPLNLRCSREESLKHVISSPVSRAGGQLVKAASQ